MAVQQRAALVDRAADRVAHLGLVFFDAQRDHHLHLPLVLLVVFEHGQPGGRIGQNRIDAAVQGDVERLENLGLGIVRPKQLVDVDQVAAVRAEADEVPAQKQPAD